MKKIFYTMAIAAALFAGYSAYNAQNSNELTDIALANVEALAASDEGTTPTETWQVGKKVIKTTVKTADDKDWEWSIEFNTWFFKGKKTTSSPDSYKIEETTVTIDCCRKLGNLKSCSNEPC